MILRFSYKLFLSYYSILKESERKKTVSINEKDAKISDLKKANKKFDDHVKKLTTETTGLRDQVEKLKIDVSPVEFSLSQRSHFDRSFISSNLPGLMRSTILEAGKLVQIRFRSQVDNHCHCYLIYIITLLVTKLNNNPKVFGNFL